MSNIRRFTLAVLLLLPCLSFANQTASGFCTTGGIKVTTFGSPSSNPVQGSYPGCSITVNIHGGGLATITDANGGPLSNPFTASSITGFWEFSAANGFYDVTLSGGTPALPSPVTIVNLLLNDPGSAAITASTFTGTGFISSTAGTAATGIFRCASLDSCLNFRNSANTLDLAFKKTGIASGNLPADVLDASVFGGIKSPQFFSNTANSAATGVLSCATGDTCAAFRNQANSADIAALTKDSSDRVVVGGAAGLSTAAANVTNGATIGTTLSVGGASSLQGVTTTTVTASGEIAPSITGGAMGDTAHRFDAFIGNLDVSGTVTGMFSGSGTPNTIPKFTAVTTVGNSSLTDNGTTVSTTEALAAASAAITGNISGATLGITGLATLSGGACYKFENGNAVVKVSAACGYVTWAAALASCPATGCILDGTAPDVPLAMGAFDTGSNTKPVTVRLGPYNFTATQITVRQGLDFAGAGVLSTNLTSIGTNAQPLFVNPQVNNNAITVKIHDFSANALVGNTSQDGFFFDCSTLTNAGVELSRFDNIIFNGFKGAVVHFKATQDGVSGSIGCTQGNTLTNITAIRPTGATAATQNALRIEGGAGQFDLWNCWLDGQTSDTGTNVFVGTTGTQAPYSIHFHSTTNQNGFAYLFDGGTSITTVDDHFEVIKGAYNLANTSQLLVGLNFKTPHINGNVGVNAGNGYIVNIPNTVTNADVTLDTPFMGISPDNLVKNLAGNSATVKVINARTFNSATPVNTYVSSGVTGTLNAAATVDLKGWVSIQVNTSVTSMTTFKSTLMPGETVTLYATGGPIQFALGGNLTFGSQSSPLIIQSGDSVTFMRVDAGTPAFILISNPYKPTLTSKKGSGAGNYISASTTYVVMDATNLCYTVTIPTGWKLAVTTTAEMNTATAAVTFFLAVTDNAACGTANAGIIAETTAASTGTGTDLSVSLNPVIAGDGASHNVALQYKTSNAADSATAVNASATRTPMMTFTLSPSN